MVGQVGAKALIAASLHCEEMGGSPGIWPHALARAGRLPGRRPTVPSVGAFRCP
jgi:hypothetical protein